MPIPDEAREAAIDALSSAGVINRSRAEWSIDCVRDALTCSGYTVVKVTDLQQQASATPDDPEVVARRLGYVPIPDEQQVVTAIHDAVCHDPMCTGDMPATDAAAAVLALLRGEGQ